MHNKFNSISIVLPAFNEARNVETSVTMVRDAMAGLFEEIEIIVVDDGSTDDTAGILATLRRGHNDLLIIRHAENRGYGAALCSGLFSAKKDLVFFTDADRQFDLREVRRLVAWIHDYDLVVGYRKNRADPWHRRFNARGWNLLVRLILGLQVEDIDCAFKLFRREIFDRIELVSAGAMINTELFARARQLGLRFKEVPVSHYPRAAGKQSGANPKVVLTAFGELIRIRRCLRRLR